MAAIGSEEPHVFAEGTSWQTIPLVGRMDLSYFLVDNLDLSGATIFPIGHVGENNHTPFNGTFNGKGFTISNGIIESLSKSYVGLFAVVGEQGQIKNLNLTDLKIKGYRHSEDLADDTNDYLNKYINKIEDILNLANKESHVTESRFNHSLNHIKSQYQIDINEKSNFAKPIFLYDSVDSVQYEAIAALAGKNNGLIINCLAEDISIEIEIAMANLTDTVASQYKSSSFSGIGGLIGLNYGSIVDSSINNFNLEAFNTQDNLLVVYYDEGYEKDSQQINSIIFNAMGVLVGHNYGVINNCHSTGIITIDDLQQNLLIIRNLNLAYILDNNQEHGSQVNSSLSKSIGGLAGINESSVFNSTAHLEIEVSIEQINILFSEIDDTVANIKQNNTRDIIAGGLVGHNKENGVISDCTATISFSDHLLQINICENISGAEQENFISLFTSDQVAFNEGQIN